MAFVPAVSDYSLPILVNWSLTSRCNLNCKFCFRLQDEDPSVAEKHLILGTLISQGVNRITFTGGEPLLDKSLCGLLKRCKEHNVFTSVHTNALHEEELLRIVPYVNRISLSLDGPNNRTNYEMREVRRYFDVVISRITLLKSNNVDFAIKTIVTKKNANEIRALLPIIEKLQPSFWSIFQFRAIRIGLENRTQFQISNREFAKVVSELGTSAVKVNTLSNCDAARYPIFLIGGKGNVYTNSRLGDTFVGSLFTERVKSLWDRILEHNRLCDKHISKYRVIKGN